MPQKQGRDKEIPFGYTYMPKEQGRDKERRNKMKSSYKTGSVDQIVAQAAEELKMCTFIIYIADDARFEEISKKFHAALPNAKKIGTTGFMFADKTSYDSGITAVGFMDDEVEVYVGTLRKVDTCPIRYLPGLIWSVEQIKNKYKNNICLEFTTGYEEKVVSTMKVSLEKYGVRLVGGTAGNAVAGQPKKVSCNGKVLTDSTVFAVIGSKMGKIEVYKENLFHTRKKTHIVTKVSEDNRVVLELDGRKAMDVYEEEIGYTDSNVEDGIYSHPLCRMVGAEHYITAIFSFDKAERSITVYKNVQINDMICFTDIDEDYEEFIKGNMNRIKSNYNIEGIISINCILRYLFFLENNFHETYAKLMHSAANGNHLGMVSDGEQYIEQHVNQSMVCAVFTRDK